MSPARPKTLVDVLRVSATSSGSKAITFVESERAPASMSYAELFDTARVALGGLRDLGIRQGDRVMLVLRRPSEFVPLFWACVLGAVVPVPLAPPLRAEDSDELRKLAGVWHLLGHPRVIVESGFASAMDALLDPSGRERAAVDADQVRCDGAAATPAMIRPEDTAFIQFSSGSTSSPRGVVLTHANLLANTAQIADRIPLGPEDVELGWMPHYHDMGLIGSHLTPLARGAQQVRIETTLFLRHPERWLDIATTSRATILTATNTSLRLFLRKVLDASGRGWDLKHVHALLVGAEPISPKVLRDTTRLLAPAGLGPHVLRGCYGLAEASVAVCMTGPSGLPRIRRLSLSALSDRRVVEVPEDATEGVVELPESGWAVKGLEVRVVDDADVPVGESAVGHIQFRGPNASPGYLDDEAATAAARCGDWWRTGDLGFLVDGRLTVCGRVKELLLVGGRNLFAQDIEAVAAAEPGVRTAVACAAPSPDATHELALLFIVPSATPWQSDPTLVERVRRRVTRVMHVSVDEIIPIGKEEIAHTSSGKIKRFRLAERFAEGRYQGIVDEVRALFDSQSRAAPEPLAPARGDHTMQLVISAWAAVLGVDPGRIRLSDRFDELGGTSVAAQEILSRLQDATGVELGQAMLAACPTVEAMADWIRHPPERSATERTAGPRSRAGGGRDIAVIGMACRMPGADSPEAFWGLLARGEDRIGPIPAGRWPERALAGIRCRRGAFLDDPYTFDPGWFHLGDEEARVMDPQQRVLLSIGAECMGTAGYAGMRGKAFRTGVFVGASQVSHQELVTGAWQRAEAFASLQATESFAGLPEAVQVTLRRTCAELTPAQAVHASTLVGNLPNMLAARLSHELDLRGPAMTIDTACSSSLVAVHEACESLLRGECDLALAGGVSLNITPGIYRFFEAAGALSPSGRIRPFSAEADGFVPGEGAALLLLRPLADAVADGDEILAVIKGSAVNNDGRSIGVMAPNPAGQLAVLEAAYACAGVDPASVDSIECHGTGTRIGDPIELRTVAEFFGGRGAGRVRVGSVKSNIGHLLGAAGIAGLMKVILSMTRGRTPPSLHASPPHPRLAERPLLHVPSSLEPWQPGSDGRLYAGVSSFGFGGTNCHVVVASWPLAPGEASNQHRAPASLLALSAPTEAHLAAWGARLASLAAVFESSVDSAAEELLAREPSLARAARVVRRGASAREALAGLASSADRSWHRATYAAPTRPPRVAWLFPGQGSQFVGAAAGVFDSWRGFRDRFESLASKVTLERPLLSFCYGPDASDDELRRTDVAQPLLAAFQIAMVDGLRGLGLEPAAVVGHSVGELAAAYASGAIDAETAVGWAAARGRMMQELAGDGAMIAVLAGPERVQQALARYSDRAGIAAYNGPEQTIVAGERTAIESLAQELLASEVTVLRVPVRHAFHSRWVAPAAERFAEWLGDACTRPLRIPLASTVTGSVLAGQSLAASYWPDQVRKPVRFVEAVRALDGMGIDLWLELGPGTTLTGLVQRIKPELPPRNALSLTRREAEPDPDADYAHLLETLGELWLRCAPLQRLPRARHGGYRRVSLPGPAFLPRSLRVAAPPSPRAATSLLRVRAWNEAPARAQAIEDQGLWLLLAEQPASVVAMTKRLRDRGRRVVTVAASSTFGRSAEDQFTADLANSDHLRWIMTSFPAQTIARVVLWPTLPDWDMALAQPRAARDGLVGWMLATAAVVQAAEKATPESRIAVVVRSGCATHLDTAPVEPCAAALGVFARGVLGEHPGLRGGVIDVESNAGGELGDVVAEALLTELIAAAAAPPLVALRGSVRLVPTLRSIPVLKGPHPQPFPPVWGEGSGAGPGAHASQHLRQPRRQRSTAERRANSLVPKAGAGPGSGRLIPRPEVLADMRPYPPPTRGGGSGWGLFTAGRELPTAMVGGAPVYVVFGAASELAAHLVDSLAGQAHEPARIVAVTRRKMSGHGFGGEVAERIADVTDREAVGRVLAETEAIHGRIDGVIHAAGTLIAGSASGRTRGELEQVLDPKMLGVLHLARGLAGRDVGFVALQSSVSAVRDDLAVGIADYAAANAFLDAAAARMSHGGQRWTSIGWAPWRGVGMARALPDDGKTLTTMLAPLDARRAFLGAMATRLPHVIVAPASFLPAVEALAGPEPAAAPPAIAKAGQAPQERPAASRQEPRERDLEADVRAMLASALRLDPVEVDPDTPFQSLGLSSLAAVDLLKELEKLVGCKLSTTLLFEHNTLARIVAYLREVRPDTAPAQLPPASPKRFPLLPAQQTFYANQAFQPDLPGYVFLRLELDGPASIEALDRALAVLFRRHAMLRVTIGWEDDELVQRDGGFALPRVELVQLHDTDGAGVARALDEVETRMRNEVFDLASGPLFRIALCRIGPERSCLMFNIHHIVADAWSAQIVATELLELHGRILSGNDQPLAPLQSTFDQCARALLDGARGDEASSAAYWKQTLQDASDLPLPFDGDPSAAPSGTCHLHQVELDEASTSRLAALARSWAVSPFHLLFAAYLVCLQRWSGRNDIVVRVANARREARIPDIQRVVGCFADSLPIRVALRDDEPWPQLARRVLDATVAAQAHPFTSSMQLAGMRGRASQASPRGVTPAGLSFPDFQAPERYGPVRVTSMRGGSASAFSQLGLIAWQFAGRLHLSWNHIESLFRPETVRKLASEHLAVLKDLAATEAIPAGEVQTNTGSPPKHADGVPMRHTGGGPLRGLAQSDDCCSPSVPLPPGAVVHERIWTRARQVPERVAVVFEGQSLTYEALRRAATELAGSLRHGGVGPGSLVAVLAPPGIEAVIALLGVLSSGAAYVPLSPDYPDDRLLQIASHARAAHVVTTVREARRLAALRGLRLRSAYALDGTAAAAVPELCDPAVEAATVPSREAAPDDLAYVMYTSGTTGAPKGVMVTHRAVSLFHDWVHEAFDVRPDDRFIQTSSLAFGGSIRQIYSPLLAGATVFPAPVGLTRDPFALVEFLERNAITIWNSVPTLWMRLLECVQHLDADGRTTELERLRWILIGGEHVPAAHVRRWMDRFGTRHRIANLYGSTETVVNASWHVVRGRPADEVLHTPIGTARAGSRMLLLGDDARPVGAGETGEIHVGGPSLASGYLHAPEFTAEAFISLPGVEGPVYRTGDLARQDPNGDFVYLGRRDTQVKIRGNRVELGEIEGVLGLHPDVGAAAVVEWTSEDRQWLVGFVEPARSVVPEPPRLRALVASKLPEFMVPHRVEVLERLPRTPAGKLDRRALVQRLGAPAAEEPSDEPVTATERAIARAWCAVLRVPRAGRHDDFFDLGGDSILALQALQRLRKELPVVPRPMTLYAERTVARLAAAIDGMRLAAPSAGKSRPARTASDDEWFELSPSQESFVLAQRGDPNRSPVWCARIPIQGRFDRGALKRAADLAFERHPMLRAEIATHGLATVQRTRNAVQAPLEVVDLRSLAPMHRPRLLRARFEAERSRVLPLDSWPLWHMSALLVDEDRWELLLTVHHAIGDGWSVHVLGSELLGDYDAALDGRAPPDRPMAASYRLAVAHLRSWPAEAVQEAERGWAERFTEPWPAAALPAGGRDGSLPADASELVGETFAPGPASVLRSLARGWQTSLHTVVLTAWLRALRRATGCSDLVTGVATSGRDLPLDGVEGTFGCFATGLPLRANVSGAAFERDLRAVERALGEATAGAALPIERLLRAIPRHPGLDHPPGRSFFFSWMEFASLPAIESSHLTIGWSEAEFHFDAAATGTELMLGVLARDELRLRMHGGAPAGVRAEVLGWLLGDLQALCGHERARAIPGVAVDSVIIAYLPAPSSLRLPGIELRSQEARTALRRKLLPSDRPALVETLRTRLGSSGTVLLPVFSDELLSCGRDVLAGLVADAVELAAAHGARVVSLAGILPSLTDYALGVATAVRARAWNGRGAPSVTTGHAATALAVAGTTRLAMRELGWNPGERALGVMGFGSIGQTALHLLLDEGWHPREIVIAEIASRLPYLQAPLASLRERFDGPVRVVASGSRAPEELLVCDVIVAATSEGDLLDAESLRPGTLVVDDSFPPAIDPDASLARMKRAGDILVLRGGQLDLGQAERRVLVDVSPALVEEALRKIGIDGVPGCRAESIVAAADPSLPRIVGLVGPDQARAWRAACARLGIGPAPLHCGAEPIDPGWLQGVARYHR